MDTINYDFESQLEQGFQSLFESIDKRLYTADDVDSELPNEHIKIEIDTGGPNSNEHLNAGGQYDNYTGSIEIVIQTPRVADDQVTITQNVAENVDAYDVTGAGSSEVYGRYVRNGNSADGRPVYTRYVDGVATHNIWGAFNIVWILSDGPIEVFFPSNYYQTSDSSVGTAETPPNGDWGAGAAFGGEWVPPLPTTLPVIAQSTIQFKSRHAELVAITRKTLEEIDAAVLSTNWPNALSPTKIKPTGTERENDAEHRMTRLSYELQFRIA